MRIVFLVAILGLPALAIGNAVVFGLELRSFLRTTPRLTSSHDLERFKVAVARQMYAALVQILLLVLPPVLFGIALVQGVLTPSDVLLVIMPAAVVILVAAAFRHWEQAMKAIPVADPELATLRDRVVTTWVKRPVPDW